MSIKKLICYFIRYVLAIIIFVSCFIFKPSNAYAKSANTLAGLRADLKIWKLKKEQMITKMNLTQSQINSKKNEINNANQEITNM